MSKFKVIPKAVRHIIYVKALQCYGDEMTLHVLANRSMTTGICSAVSSAIKYNQLLPFVKDNIMDNIFHIKDGYNPYLNIQCYPELSKHIPEVWDKNGYWYLPTDTAIRISILKDAIECSKLIKRVKPYEIIQL